MNNIEEIQWKTMYIRCTESHDLKKKFKFVECMIF